MSPSRLDLLELGIIDLASPSSRTSEDPEERGGRDKMVERPDDLRPVDQGNMLHHLEPARENSVIGTARHACHQIRDLTCILNYPQCPI